MNAKNAHITYEQARRRDNKPVCRYCYGPCDPRSREYRGMTLCPPCYRDEPLTITTQPKELLCQPQN
jgi:hypothetical protein